MNCPQCNSSNVVKLDSDLRKNYYLCRADDCKLKWEKTRFISHILSFFGAIATLVTNIAAIVIGIATIFAGVDGEGDSGDLG